MKYIIFILLLFLLSCKGSSEPTQQEVARLFIDILVAEETHKTNIDLMKVVVDSLYEYHNITEAIYTASLADYKTNEETWNAFFNLADEYLDTLKAIEKRDSEVNLN